MKRISKDVIILIIGMIITKGASFLQNMVLAYKYGTNALSDSFVLALMLPNTIFGAIAGSMALCYVPVYQKNINKKQFSKNKYMTLLIVLLLTVGVLMSIFIALFSKEIVQVIASNASEETVKVTTKLIKVIGWSSSFVFIVGIFQGYFQSIGMFKAVAFITIPLNIGIVISLSLSSKNNLTTLSYGILLSYILQASITMFIAVKNKFRFSFKDISQSKNYVITTLVLFLPLFAGNLINDVNTVVDKSFAANLGTGIISGLDYGYKVSGIMYAVLANPILTVVYPKLSLYYGTNKEKEAIKLLSDTFFSFELIYFFVMILLMLLAEPICRILFYRGNFDDIALHITSNALALYSLSLFPMVCRNTLEKIFLCNGNTKIPLMNAAFTVGANIILNLIFSKVLGFRGLPIATALAFTFSSIFLYINAKKRYGYMFEHTIIIKTKKLVMSLIVISVLGIILSSTLSNFVDDGIISSIIKIASLTIFMSVLYIILIQKMKLYDIKSYLQQNKKEKVL